MKKNMRLALLSVFLFAVAGLSMVQAKDKSESVAIPIAHAYIDALKNEDPSIPVLMVGSIPAALPEYLLQT